MASYDGDWEGLQFLIIMSKHLERYGILCQDQQERHDRGDKKDKKINNFFKLMN